MGFKRVFLITAGLPLPCTVIAYDMYISSCGVSTSRWAFCERHIDRDGSNDCMAGVH